MKNITPNTNLARRQQAFTLTDLLAVVAMGVIILFTLSPVFAGAKYKTKTSMCAFNMRLWGMATSMYESDNHDFIPFFADSTVASKLWFDYLESYIGRAHAAGSWVSTTNNYSLYGGELSSDTVRRCPAGNGDLNAEHADQNWDTWVGANYGKSGSIPLSWPFFYYENGACGLNPPLSITRIRKPADALAYMDTRSFFVYSPMPSGWVFDSDLDGDGVYDTSSSVGYSYNYARPKVHENGANVTLLDGHVERVAFKDLWGLKNNLSAVPGNSFWNLED